MTGNKLITNFLTWGGVEVKLTWHPGDDLKKFQPFNQVYGVCFDDEGKILIQRVGESNWCLPGGTVESGENAEQALSRELIEETDVTFKNPILLGGQHIQFLNGPNPNPRQSVGDDFYQLRYYCEVDQVFPQTPDPDNDQVHDRLFVKPSEITHYFDWGKIGQAIFDQAVEIFRSHHQS